MDSVSKRQPPNPGDDESDARENRQASGQEARQIEADQQSDPARDAAGEGWSAEGGATPGGPATAISSDRVGPTGPGQCARTGTRDTSPADRPADPPPEQSTGGPEKNPEGLAPRARYPSLDPRSEDDEH